MPEVLSRGFAACVFGLCPKTGWPAADEAHRHTQEKTSGTQGNYALEGSTFCLRKCALFLTLVSY